MKREEKVRQYLNKIEKEYHEQIRSEIKRRIAKSVEDKKRLKEKTQKPRYDEVFYKGVEWLDSL